jgi:DNA helicase-2/ATP-dependent DNA helicase PcrA
MAGFKVLRPSRRACTLVPRTSAPHRYAGVYVDEYQDCSDLQHVLVCALAEFLPSRVLGDPMQAIFDFDEGKPVDWGVSVYPHFECLGQLEIPWRWEKAGEPKLGAWLKEARKKLEQGQKIDLLDQRPLCVVRVYTDPEYLASKQYSSLCDLLGNNESVIALHGGDQQSKNKTHLMARTTAGRFSSIEEVEGKELHSFVKKFGAAKTTQAGFLLALEFAKKCFTGVGGTLTAGTKRGEVAKQNKGTKYPLVLHAANTYLNKPISTHLKSFFLALKANPDTSAFRRDLLYRFLNVLKIHIDGEGVTLSEAASLYQRETVERDVLRQCSDTRLPPKAALRKSNCECSISDEESLAAGNHRSIVDHISRCSP